ncbi:hypothetical protein [Nocardioides flavescens]|uniref:Uncharacterized protein n=1 Tax=Nocardioides flavescens TaxID=2691959 RepID=A0A6L7EXL8_9ACTN|nr:hypothetical protein [Nocardioides flavescens]MXG88431.1 hypothetical protein [Nocardioides flavescens]
MNEVVRDQAVRPGLLPTKQEREFARAQAGIVLGTRLTATRVDAEAALTGRIMERVVDIDGYRRALAANDETLNAVLTRIELGFIAKAEQIQRGSGSAFDL